jgi:class 3 adenylate cyclase
MTDAPAIDLATYRARLDEVVNRTLRRGSLVAAALGLLSGALLCLAIVTTDRSTLWLPAGWAFCCGAYSLFVFLLARAERVRGGAAWAVMLGFVSLPGTIYLAAAILHPSGAATYLTGPPSYLYFFLIAVSGLALHPRLAQVAGLFAGVQYLLFVLLDAGALRQLSAPDPLLVDDVTAPQFYYFKSLLMVFTGLVVGVIAANARRLVERMLAEEHEKRSISRLFGEFVSPEVREKILREKSGVQGEKKPVAVLFSDLRSFTAFSERHDPEVVVARLNRYFDGMVECITREGGVVDKFIGDAVMAVFGGVLALDDPCGAAFRAARAMRLRLAELNRQWTTEGLEPLENGIGLHFGVALQGTIGSRDRKEFTVVGDSVNTASRLEGLCKDHAQRILLSQAVYERLDAAAQRACTSLGTVTVKGKSEPIRLWGAADPEPRG